MPIPAAGMKPLADRWQDALARAVAKVPHAFAGTDLDPAAVIQRMEKLVTRIESLLSGLEESSSGLSPTELLAAKLRSALATNAMGGRVSEEAKWRSAATRSRTRRRPGNVSARPSTPRPMRSSSDSATHAAA